MSDTTAAKRGTLTKAQIKRITKPVRADRVETKQGRSYVAQHEVRAELARTFGPGRVDHTMTPPVFQWEQVLEPGQPGYPTNGDGKKPYYVVCFMGGCTLRAYDYAGDLVYECTEFHAEANAPLPDRGEAYAMAITSVQSYALRRAAISLGDNMGLHLYENGSLAPLIGGTLALEGDVDSPLALPDEVSETNWKIRNPQAVAAGEVWPGAPVAPAAPAAPADEPAKAPAARTRKPAAAPAEAPAVPQVQDAFKKPTAAAVKAASA